MKNICLVAFVFILGVAQFNVAYGAGECGKASPDNEAWKLIPCASAAQSENAAVSAKCCSQVKRIGQNPSCLCAVMLSNTAKSSGVKPEIAVTIPKRCNIPDRPIGYKCGGLWKFSTLFIEFNQFLLMLLGLSFEINTLYSLFLQLIHYPEE